MAAPPAPPRPRSLAAPALALGALLLGASLFLPWVRLDRSAARAWREAVERKIRERPLAPEPEEEYRRLAETLEATGALRGTDLLLWTDVARRYAEALARGAVDRGPLPRTLGLVRAALLLLPVGAFLLLAMLLAARLGPPSAFVLAVAFLLGVVGVALAAALERARAQLDLEVPELGRHLGLGPGVWMLLGGGALLALAAPFGARVRQLVPWLLWVGVLGGGAALGVLGVLGRLGGGGR